MPIVFVHGVAVRDPDDPQYAAALRLTRGADWAVVEAMLRAHVAPAVRPSAPERVTLVRVYWGDLGAQPGAASDAGPAVLSELDTPAALTPSELGEALQHSLFQTLPPAQWPAVVDAVWSTVSDPALRAQLAARSPKRQARWLEKQVRGRLKEAAPELSRGFGQVAADLAASNRRNVRWAMGEVRRPFHEVVPVFVGDVLHYLDGRGVPGTPGPIVERVLAGLAEARDAERGAGEPLVVLSHSMGGQLVYDALTTFAGDVPGGMPRVDFWCASGGQIGLFAELGMFAAGPGISDGSRGAGGTLGPDGAGGALGPDGAAVDSGAAGATGVGSAERVPEERLGYLWNAWSSSDVLSFPAEGRIADAHDSDFAFPGGPGANHMAYLVESDFYRTFAAKVRAHCPAPRRSTRHGLAKYGEISD